MMNMYAKYDGNSPFDITQYTLISTGRHGVMSRLTTNRKLMIRSNVTNPATIASSAQNSTTSAAIASRYQSE